jgi:hypothetical protein
VFKKYTSTARICADKSTPIQWGSVMMFGGQYVNPPKKSKPIVYSTTSHSRIDAFEIYDRTYDRKLKKLWLNLVQEIYQDKSHRLKKRQLNEWEKMLLKKFGHKLVQIKEEKPI